MTFTWFDAVGLVGVALVLSAYVALERERLRPNRPLYYILNGIGAALILLSLVQDWNLSAATIEIAWLLISVLGVIRTTRRPKTS